MPTLIRKQLSVTAEQDRALKQRSRELGVSEAELVRRAIDAALFGSSPSPPALQALVAHTREHGRDRTLEKGWSRDDLYDRGTSREP